MSTDETFALKPFNHRPMPIARIISAWPGPRAARTITSSVTVS